MDISRGDNVIMSSGLIIRPTLTLATAALLASCGGGGSSGGGVGTSGGTGFASLPAASTLAATCVAPRIGIDPATGSPYPDRQGTLLNEQNWLAAWTNDLYLWYGEVPYPNPAVYSDTISYFDALKTTNLTSSGAAKDRFHFTYDTSVWQALSSNGVQAGYGATWALLSTTPPRRAMVAYTEPGTPATSLSPALARGASILRVDGVDLVNDSTQAGIGVINAGLFPAKPGESHTFVVQDLGAATTRTVTMISAKITSVPVQNVSTLASGAVGYMLFNDHLATAEPALINAVTQLRNANVTDLVLDIRYNGGGFLSIASELAYMIAGPARTSGKTFELLTFNNKHPTIDPVTLSPITPIPFQSTATGTSSTPAGTALPYLNLSRVFLLTGSETCSASESIMNSLRGAGVQVIQIGSTTCGKPYGFYPTDNCGTTYFSIQFKGVNNAGFGDYTDGFAPQNGATAGLAASAVLPGCSIGDDFTHALGSASEARLAAALQYRATGGCPAAGGLVAMAQAKRPSESDGFLYKSPFLSNRILTR
jgi:carboxyl-terminal processing protease